MPRTATVVLLAVLVLAGCSGGSSTGPPPTPSTPVGSPDVTRTADAVVVPPAPRRAACYRLTTDQLTRPTNSSRPVPCSQSHTAKTIHVGRLDTVVSGHSVAVDSEVVQKQVVGACRREFAAYVGGTSTARRLSRLNVVWFSPTLQQSDQGADWFRCDVVAFRKGDDLLALPGATRLRGVLDGSDALDTYGLCGTAAPGARGFERVLCGRRHAWRAISVIGLAGQRMYPGVAAVRRAGDSGCKDAARAEAEDTLRFSYGWEWPTAGQWAVGRHFGYCWAPEQRH